MRRTVLAALTALVCAGTLSAADLSTPEAAIALPAEALRTNNLIGLFETMPPADQAKAEADWDQNRQTMSPQKKAEANEFFTKVLAPDAVDQMMAEAEPNLAQMNPAEMAGMVQMIGGMMAMQMGQDPKSKAYAPMVQGLVMDVAAWLPTAGLEDPAKLKQTITHFIAAVKKLDVTNADELCALDLRTLLTRSGAALAEGKKCLSVYGIDADAFLGSLKVTDVAGDGDKRDAKLNFTAFGKPYQLPVKLAQKEGMWTFDSDALQAELAPALGGMAPGMGGGDM